MKVALLFLLTSVFATDSTSQSKKETEGWILDKLAKLSTSYSMKNKINGWGREYDKFTFTIKDGVLHIKHRETYYNVSGKRDTIYHDFSIMISKVTDVTFNHYTSEDTKEYAYTGYGNALALHLSCSKVEDRQVQNGQKRVSEVSMDKYAICIIYPLTEKDIAARMAKAFKHLAEFYKNQKCYGEELF